MNGPAATARRTESGAGHPATAAVRRVLFGHQSVGANVMEGLSELLAERPDLPYRLYEGVGPAEGSGTALHHVRLGRNGDPASKLADFAERVAAADATIAAMKFCYVDVDPSTDADALFAAYRNAMAALAKRQPGLTIVHVTMPLTADRGTAIHLRTVLRGNGARSDRRLNAIRHRYNELLRQEYAGREPIFDLAAVESTGADGRGRAVRYGGATVPVLAREWTNDGGHLNAAGRRRAAEAFLGVLASL